MTLKTPPPSYVGAWALHWLGSVVCFRFLIALFGLHEISVHAAQMGVSPLVGSCLFLLLFLVVSALTMGVSCGLFAITVHAFTVKRWCEARALPVPPRATLPYTRAWWSYFGGFFLWLLLNSLLVTGRSFSECCVLIPLLHRKAWPSRWGRHWGCGWL